MLNVAPSSLDAQLFGLGTLIQLLKRARRAASAEELAFVMVNETHILLPYRQAALWRRDARGVGKVVTVSGVAVAERNAPFMLWLGRALSVLEQDEGRDSIRAVDGGDLEGELGKAWAEWLPAHGLMVPLRTEGQSALGTLLFARENPWSEGDRHLMQELADGYSYAWANFQRGRQQRFFAALRRRSGLLKLALAAAVFGLMWLPVTLSALAPAEVVPFQPTIVRAPLEGVVDHFEVQPNEQVREGQALLVLDRRAIENKLEVAAKALAVAEAEYRQAAQQAVFDDKSRSLLAVLKGRMEQRQADVSYTKSLLDRVRITASRSGLALFDDPNTWTGRPVAIGEKLLEIADPDQAELEIWLPVSDAITLKPDADVDFFLNVSPGSPVHASLRQASYEATQSPSGLLGYRLKAKLAAGTQPPRIGLKGTAKLYGERVTLFYYLLRRPLAAARQLVGF
ncbi:HlyD family efflux transporter periplasmic adaptor subunit [Bosea sp. 685]|uniref:HlyD family efflux transporter periplasmic adaptor subunit n=1 Tax=Bosea sp. 685 TaxID=3080057 RepID=UPI0028935F77|nr:HlyD family efflux transporter periplasmic adaptor subunit [Bosea sp. 685]WNJ91577.1 HlyD family efflux transporter periplasmic adaptor subunit [Bosea sp. 685]